MSAQIVPGRPPAGIEALRVPPHAIDAEQAVLGALILTPAAMANISDWLREEDFYRKDHRLIYRAITALIARGTPVDTVTLMDWFDDAGLSEMIGGSSYLIELDRATASAANIVAYAEIVAEKSRLRSIIDIGMTITEGAYTRHADAGVLIGDAMRSLSQMQIANVRGGLEPSKSAMARMQTELMARYQRGPQLLGLPWPWPALNTCTNGLRDGVLYVVGARPSMGKSVFALQTALHVALTGQRVAFFSVEMTADECMARAVACVGNIPHEWVENPAKQDEDADLHWAHLTDATKRIIDSPLLTDETPAITIDQLMARARRAHLQSPLRLVVIDHMHDMQLDPSREVRHEYGRIAQGAKTLAKELRCPVVLLAQLNRQNAGKQRPTLIDLRESGEIEQKADVVLFIHREDYYHPQTHLRGVVEVIPAKGRNIRTGQTIHLQNVYSEMRLLPWVGEIPEAFESEHKSRRRGFGANSSPRTPYAD